MRYSARIKGRGRHTALRPTLTPDERALLALTQHLHSRTVTPQLRLRCRMVLLLADGETITAIAQQMRVARKVIYKWVGRWQQEGLKGLRDQRCGRPRGRAQGDPSDST